MDTKKLKCGDLVVVGKRAEVESGYGGSAAIFLARGKYIYAPTPCGQAVVHFPAASAVKNVVAVNRRGEVASYQARVQYGYQSGVLDSSGRYAVDLWEPAILASTTLHDHAVWKFQQGRIEKMRRDQERWNDEKAMRETRVRRARTAITEALGINVYTTFGRAEPEGVVEGWQHGIHSPKVLILDHVVDALEVPANVTAARKLAAAYRQEKDRYATWLEKNPDPSQCQL